jgi:hypothetical protein
MRRSLGLILGVAAAALTGISCGAIEWRTDFRGAFEEAQERGAPVFIFLGQVT